MSLWLKVARDVDSRLAAHNAIEAQGFGELAAAWELGGTPNLTRLDLLANQGLEWGANRLGYALRAQGLPKLQVRGHQLYSGWCNTQTRD